MDRNEQIDRFVRNEMAREERQEFCSQIMANPDLKKEVTLRALLAEAATLEAEKEALQALRKHPANTMRRKLKTWSSIVAVAVLLSTLWLIGNGYRYTPLEIFNQYYETPIIEPSRGEGNVKNTLQEAATCLEQGKGEKTIELLNTEILQSDYSDEAEWLLLCAYLQTQNRKKATILATTMSQKQSEYSTSAGKVLMRLKEKRWF